MQLSGFKTTSRLNIEIPCSALNKLNVCMKVTNLGQAY